ncbi:MAG: hypothetical protein O2971_08545 [Proteobacteria bacterium]|nr:hypothetical protein [Pseudomonadota bacterium]
MHIAANDNQPNLREILLDIFEIVNRDFAWTGETYSKPFLAGLFNNDKTPEQDNDCFDFCNYCRSMLYEYDIQSRLVYCEIERHGKWSRHFVVEVQGWILDANQETVVPNTMLDNYRWKSISGYKLNEGWREIVGFSM